MLSKGMVDKAKEDGNKDKGNRGEADSLRGWDLVKHEKSEVVLVTPPLKRL